MCVCVSVCIYIKVCTSGLYYIHTDIHNLYIHSHKFVQQRLARKKGLDVKPTKKEKKKIKIKIAAKAKGSGSIFRTASLHKGLS